MNVDPLASVRSSTDPLDLAAAARDLWPGGTLRFWKGEEAPRPDRVYWPSTEDEAVALLRALSADGISVVPYGAGSGVCGGARGLSGSVVVDCKALDRIGPLDEERLTVDAQAGVNGQHLEDWLNARGYTLGHSPSSIWCSTVGGWAAARGAGQFSSKYGVFEDMVQQIRMATPGRGLVTIGEDGDAPDEWMPLALGSEGTLGVITRVRMRVWPLPATRWLRGYRFPDIDSAVRAMRRLMQEELWPVAVRLYDPVDTRIGGRTKQKHDGSGNTRWFQAWLEGIDGLPGVRKRSLSLPLTLAGVVNRVFGRLASGCLLIVGWEGDPEVVAVQSAAGHALLCEEGEDLGEETGQRWYDSRHAVSFKLMPIFERGGFADTMEVACRWSQLVPLYQAIRKAVSHTAVVMAHMSHLYPEGGSIYFSFAGRGSVEVYEQTWRAALQACLEVGATVTHHHGVGSLKAEAASAEVGPAADGWRQVKVALDPAGILNPGRLYLRVPHRDPGPPPVITLADGLGRAPASADLPTRQRVAKALGGEPRWPWEQVAGPPRWQRLPWQISYTEVDGRVDGKRCRIGRGPRSAAGPDLRPWLIAHSDPPATADFLLASDGERWMGEGRPDRPWAVALELLRGDLRPAVLTVRQGTLRVGFRGVAAAALGALATDRVPGGLSPVDWAPVPLPSGPLEPCDLDDPAVVCVTLSGAYRRAGEAP